MQPTAPPGDAPPGDAPPGDAGPGGPPPRDGYGPPPSGPARGPRWDRSQGLQLGRHRYLRSSDDKVVSGVAGGLADLTGIDPIVWRIAFVILALSGGFGILVYLALWLLAPQRMPGAHVPRPSNPVGDGVDWRTLVGLGLVGIAVLAILPFSGDGSLLAGLVLLGLGAWLWSSDRRPPDASGPSWPSDPAAPDPTAAWTPPTTPTAGGGPDGAVDRPVDAVPTSDATATTLPETNAVQDAGAGPVLGAPSASDRGVGGVPYAADGGWGGPPREAPPAAGPAPVPPVRPAPPRQRSILGRLTFAVALLFVGLAALAEEVGAVDTSVGEVASWTVVLLGVGLLVGSWFGRARWLALLALPILPVALVGQAINGLDLELDGGENVDADILVTSAAQVPEDGFRYATGDLELDLSALEEPLDGPLEVRLAAGSLRVVLPEDATGSIDARAGLGEVDVLGRQSIGVSPDAAVTTFDLGDGTQRVDLDLSVGVGEIDVEVVDRSDELAPSEPGDEEMRTVEPTTSATEPAEPEATDGDTQPSDDTGTESSEEAQP